MSKLVIVESPAKAKTIQKYLGKGYEVMASMGHVRDLPKSSLGVNIAKEFRPQYLSISGKEKLIKELQSAAKKSEFVYLATDPDREGEAISWHLSYLLGLSENSENRITFGEITPKGIEDGMSRPRTIDTDLVNAQQARRILDRIVGYKLSPFLWRKIRRGLSAGRVQSVAVRIVVDRERRIEAFVPEEYWNVDVLLQPHGTAKTFSARLRTHKDAAPDTFKIENEDQAKAIVSHLEEHEVAIEQVKKSVRKRSPEPAFITSTLQQDASRRLGFTARRTMRAAQELYEGVEIEGTGVVGLITYMRTDSLRVSDEAIRQAEKFVGEKYGAPYVFHGTRIYKRKNANVQDAHEAIRPTMVDITPEVAKGSLSADQYKLYKLIWDRFVASRMSDQVLDTIAVDLVCGEYYLRANGHSVAFDGFTRLYEAATDEKEAETPSLPPLSVHTELRKKGILPQQKFTQPPARFTEASLIKVLEENGIGRPSTYAPIISTIIDRGYVERQQKALVPTALGTVVTDLMLERFSDIVDEEFSAEMEKNLDKVEEGKADWIKILGKFYKGFEQTLQQAESLLDGQRIKVPDEETDILCENCGRKMVVKTGKFGKFLACPGFPECRNTQKIVIPALGLCPRCGGKMVQRKSQKGRLFYACEKGKECGFMSWDEPTADCCPQCGKTLFKRGKKAPVLRCADEACGYERHEEK